MKRYTGVNGVSIIFRWILANTIVVGRDRVIILMIPKFVRVTDWTDRRNFDKEKYSKVSPLDTRGL